MGTPTKTKTDDCNADGQACPNREALMDPTDIELYTAIRDCTLSQRVQAST